MYNGNISETFWKVASDYSLRSYGYQYDDLNRLTSAIYRKPNDNIPVSGAYNESLSYDKNGNIKSLQRYGGSDAPSIVFQIDDLTYGYLNDNSNRLVKVTDSPLGNDHEGFKDGNKTGDDYGYDDNGNMTSDKNKNITNIEYNQLNLPKKITFGTTGTIEYIYNAAGQKLEKIVNETLPGTTVKTDYLGGFQYKDNNLQFFPTAEGYVKKDGANLSYVFQYKDHLGNVRVSYAKNASNVLEIIEENNYYPFGLKHEGYNSPNPTLGNSEAQKYKYNGKELQDELGLGMYDYGARNYDPALGRWMNIDPLAEEGRRWSPYNYGLDNPVFFIDPDGMKPRAGQSGTYYDWDEGGYRTAEGAEATFGEALANHSGGDGIDPPSKKKVEDMTPEEKNEYWRKYNEEKLLPLNESLITFAFIADGAGALSELFTVKASFKLTSLTGLFENLLNKASRFTVQSSKFDYFFGRVVTGNEHNIQRSAQNLADLTTLGIKTEKDLMRVFNKAWNSPIINKIETTHGVSIIKSASVGKNGQAIQVSFFYKGGDMGLTPTISTIIPKL